MASNANIQAFWSIIRASYSDREYEYLLDIIAQSETESETE
jgi:hypothetical protein